MSPSKLLALCLLALFAPRAEAASPAEPPSIVGEIPTKIDDPEESSSLAVPEPEVLTEYEFALLKQAATNCTYWNQANRTVTDPERLQMFHRMLLIERDLGFPHQARGLTLAAACMESAYKVHVKGDCRKKYITEKRGYGRNRRLHFLRDENGQLLTKVSCPSKGLVQQMGWWKKMIRKGRRLGYTITDNPNLPRVYRKWLRKDIRYDWEAAVWAWGHWFMRQYRKLTGTDGKTKPVCSFKPYEWKSKTRGYVRKYGTRESRFVAAANATAVRGRPQCLKYKEDPKKRRGWRCVKRANRCYERTKHHKELRRWQIAIAKTQRQDTLQGSAAGQ